MAQEISSSEVNSHIQMPEFFLKRFENPHFNSFYSYDVCGDFIKKNGRASSTNTEIGYYSTAVEQHLNQSIETPLSVALLALDKIDFEQPTISIEVSHLDTIKEFAYSLISRDPIAHKAMNDNLVISKIVFEITAQNTHDIMAIHGPEFAKEIGLFAEYTISFLINKTNIPFVLPICGLLKTDMEFYYLPISPNMAIIMMHKGDIHKYNSANGIARFRIADPEVLKSYNDYAFLTQVIRQWGYVVCNNRQELDRLKLAHQTKIAQYSNDSKKKV